MHDHSTRQEKIPAAGLGFFFALFFFVLFFLIACGLGYPILNRYDPRQTPGLSDVQSYAAMVTGPANPAGASVDAGKSGSADSDNANPGSANPGNANPGSAALDPSYRRYRVLVPWMARPIYRLAQGRIGTWDPAMFSLLISDSLFVAATAVLVLLLGARHLGSPITGLVGAFVYLANFAVPNLRLAGLVDAGEGFLMLALLWALAKPAWWLLPLIGILGALAKETFIPFSITFAAVWWLIARRDANRSKENSYASAAWIVVSWAASLAALVAVHRAIDGAFTSPIQFGLSLHHDQDYLAHFGESLTDRLLWYSFLWLLPIALPNLRKFPRPWLWAIGATCFTAFALDAFHGPATPGALARALFTITGPVLSLSGAVLLLKLIGDRTPA